MSEQTVKDECQMNGTSTAKLIVSLNRIGIDVHVQILSGHPLIECKHILNITLKVRGLIKGGRDEALVGGAIVDRGISGRHGRETLNDMAQQIKAGLDILLRIALLGQGRNDSDVDTTSGNGVGRRDGANENIILTADLRARDNDLGRLLIIGVGNRVVEETDAPNDLTGGSDRILGEVRGITDDHLGLGHFIARLDAVRNAVGILEDFINVTVQHKGSTMDSAETREALGQTAKTVQGVDVRAGTVASQGVAVALQLLDSGGSGLIEVVVVKLEAHGVRDELMRFGDKTKVNVQLSHGHCVEITSLVSFGLVGLVLVNVDEELAEATLLEQSHERRSKGLLGGGGDLQNLTVLVHVRSINGLELQVASYLGMEEHLGKITAGHDELGDQIDVVVAVGAEERRGLTGLELFIQVGKVERSTVGTVVSVAIDVQDLHALDTEQTGNDALLEAGAHDDGIVLAIGERLNALGQPVKGLFDV